MILEFKTTNKNTYRRRKYLYIDTGAEVYTTEPHSMIITGIEIKTKDYKELLEKLQQLGYKRV
jgi:hypothetical protein